MENISSYQKILEKYFTNSMIETINIMTGFEICEIIIEHNNLPKNNDYFTGIMILTGKKNFMISISVSKEVGKNLVEAITGIEKNKLLDEDIYDGLMELANIVAGSTKINIQNTEFSYELTYPFIVIGENHKMVHKKNIPITIKKFKGVDVEIIFKIFLF